MTINESFYKSEIDEFASREGYVEGITHVFGYPSPGYTLLTLTHENLEFMYSFILIGILEEKELYRLIFKNVITYEL